MQTVEEEAVAASFVNPGPSAPPGVGTNAIFFNHWLFKVKNKFFHYPQQVNDHSFWSAQPNNLVIVESTWETVIVRRTSTPQSLPKVQRMKGTVRCCNAWVEANRIRNVNKHHAASEHTCSTGLVEAGLPKAPNWLPIWSPLTERLHITSHITNLQTLPLMAVSLTPGLVTYVITRGHGKLRLFERCSTISNGTQ